MDDKQGDVDFRKQERLAEEFRDKDFRDMYVEAYSRQLLARKMREFRGDQSQSDYGDTIDKTQTVVSRLEDPSYTGWSARTLFEIARKRNVAAVMCFMDFPTFLRYSEDMSEAKL